MPTPKSDKTASNTSIGLPVSYFAKPSFITDLTSLFGTSVPLSTGCSSGMTVMNPVPFAG